MKDQFKEKYGFTKEKVVEYLEGVSEMVERLDPYNVELQDVETVAQILRAEWLGEEQR